VLIGMWLARKGIFQASKKRLAAIAVGSMSISILGGLPLAVSGTPLWDPSPTTAALIAVAHMITGIASGVGYVAIFGLIARTLKRVGPLAGSMIALGKRPLTFYLFIELMLVVILSPVAFGLGQTLHVTGAAIVAVLLWV